MGKIAIGSAPDSWGVWYADDPRQTPWPRFLAETDAAQVSLCLDTGHISYCGADNLQLIRDYPDRIGYVHLEQVDPFAIVEQDLFPCAPEVPLPIARGTLEYLKVHGGGGTV